MILEKYLLSGAQTPLTNCFIANMCLIEANMCLIEAYNVAFLASKP